MPQSKVRKGSVTNNCFILGAGMTGLAAGFASGLPIFEAKSHPGGICSSYYLKPGDSKRLMTPPQNGEAYRFEIGGGHWIFGGDTLVLNFLKRFVKIKNYRRRSSILLNSGMLSVPYPIQNHLKFLKPDISARALMEMANGSGEPRTMKDWLTTHFGPTLCKLFFHPFHELYTAGLFDRIAPQDSYKSPVNYSDIIQGAISAAPPVGYNVDFVYPEHGMGELARRLSAGIDLRFDKQVTKIDTKNKTLFFSDGTEQVYDKLLSTLPLNHMVRISGLRSDTGEDPYSSVLVLNIGAVSGDRCPEDHWLYVPESRSGFHRVGFYSNVDRSFLPRSMRTDSGRVSIYVERAYPGGRQPDSVDIQRYSDGVIRDLQELGYIGEVEVVDDTWIDVAYTWSWPASNWKEAIIKRLEENAIFPVGRYARWSFQGIAASLRDGLLFGAAFRK